MEVVKKSSNTSPHSIRELTHHKIFFAVTLQRSIVIVEMDFFKRMWSFQIFFYISVKVSSYLAFASSSELHGIIAYTLTCNPPSLIYPFFISWLEVPVSFSPFVMLVTFEETTLSRNDWWEMPSLTRHFLILISLSVPWFSFLNFGSTEQCCLFITHGFWLSQPQTPHSYLFFAHCLCATWARRFSSSLL